MPSQKISELSAATRVLTGDEFVIARSGANYKVAGSLVAGSNSHSVTQASHGFAVGDVLRLNGSSYTKAQANSEMNAEAVGIVIATSGSDDFALSSGGRITGLSGLSAGSVYYLSATTAGLLTTTEPSGVGQISKPLLVADSTTSGFLFNMRGALLVDPQGAVRGSVVYPFLKANDAATGAFTNLAAASVGAVSDPNYRTFLDLRGLNKVRFLGRLGGSIASATKIRLQYNVSSDPTIASGDSGWQTLATSSGSHTLGVTFITNEETIPAEARINPCQVRAVLYDGDGAADPTMSLCIALAYRDTATEAEDGGWVAAGETWTYASSTTFTVSGVDVTAKYHKGTRLRFKQGGGYKYVVVVASSFSTNTTVTVTGGDDYSIANSSITDNGYSYAANPQGWPRWFTYTPSYTGFSANPTPDARFMLTGGICTVIHQGTAGTSNATSFTLTLPVASAISGQYQWARVLNNSADATAPGMMEFAASTTLTLYRDGAGTAWTSSGSKMARFTAVYFI